MTLILLLPLPKTKLSCCCPDEADPSPAVAQDEIVLLLPNMTLIPLLLLPKMKTNGWSVKFRSLQYLSFTNTPFLNKKKFKFNFKFNFKIDFEFKFEFPI